MNDGATKTMVTRLEVKAIDENAHTFQGLASTWDMDLGGDVIREGAFKRTLKNWKSSKRNVPMLDSHSAFQSVRAVIGQMDEGEETKQGLLGQFSMLPEDPDAEGVFRRIKARLVDGLSIGYKAVRVEYPKTDEERKKGIYRYLDEVELREISVVMFPMNPGARIDLTTAKSLLMASKDRQLEESELAELKSLNMQIDDLLKSQVGDAPSPEEVLADPAAMDDLVGKINRIFAEGLATRIEAAQHSGRAVLTGL